MQKDGYRHLKTTSEDYFVDEDWWKKYILKWNKACDIMGPRQCLWVLRFDMKYNGRLESMEPMKWNILLQKLREKYQELKKVGKIDADV